MNAGDRRPDDTDFTKTLATVLLAEYLGVIAAKAVTVAFGGPEAAACAISLAAFCMFAFVLASNIASLAAAFAMRRDPENGGFARIALPMTAGQVAVLAASWLCSDPVFLGIAAALTAAALAANFALSPGRFLRPPT